MFAEEDWITGTACLGSIVPIPSIVISRLPKKEKIKKAKTIRAIGIIINVEKLLKRLE